MYPSHAIFSGAIIEYISLCKKSFIIYNIVVYKNNFHMYNYYISMILYNIISYLATM